MPFSIKKTYSHKMKKDQQKFVHTIINDNDEEEIIVSKKVVDGEGINNTVNHKGNRIHKTNFVYADR